MELFEVKNRLKDIKRTKFGISIPELRKYAKELAKKDYKEFININDYSTSELRLLQAFVIGYARDDIGILLKYFKNFIPYVDSWLVCDSLCQNFKIAREFPDVVFEFLMEYKNSLKEFECRIIAVMLLSFYLNDKYIDRVIKVLNGLKTERYYSQMGVAWAIATIMAKYPEKCLDYLKSSECKLDKTTYNKSLQKIRESFKISEEIKIITSGLKK